MQQNLIHSYTPAKIGLHVITVKHDLGPCVFLVVDFQPVLLPCLSDKETSRAIFFMYVLQFPEIPRSQGISIQCLNLSYSVAVNVSLDQQYDEALANTQVDGSVRRGKTKPDRGEVIDKEETGSLLLGMDTGPDVRFNMLDYVADNVPAAAPSAQEKLQQTVQENGKGIPFSFV